MAIVAEGTRERVYLPPSEGHVTVAADAKPKWKPEEEMNQDTSNLVSGRGYGITQWYEIFTPRQLVALTTFSDLVGEAREQVLANARKAAMPDDGQGINQGGMGATAYADAVATYLGLIVSKTTVFHNVLARWRAGENKSAPAFGRQALPMVWDFAEVNPFAGAGGDFYGVVDGAAKVIVSMPCRPLGQAQQVDATTVLNGVSRPLLCTDPPYYDNIGYAGAHPLIL